MGSSEELQVIDREPILIGISQAAALLGVSARHLGEMAKQGRVPKVRIGNRLMFSPAALLEWALEESRRSLEGSSEDGELVPAD